MKKVTILTAILLATTTFAQVPNYIPTNGLVSWWPFNGNANDESGNGNNGTVNGATLTTDRNGNQNSAYNFNVANWTWGANGDYIYIPYNQIYNFTEFTVSTWVKRASNGSAISAQSLSIIRRFQYGYSTPNGEAWVLELGHGTSVNGSNVYGYVIQGSPLQSFYASTNQTAQLNQWCNIIMTYSQNTINIYMDGLLIGTSINPNILLNITGNSGISIGLSDQANGHWAPFDGQIDDIGIWNRALTESEILTLYSGCNLNITSQPQDQNVPTSIGAANFSVSSSSSNALYQWQTNLGLGFQNLSNAGQYSGVTSSTLSVSNLSMTNNNQVFRCLINDAGCTDTTTIATLTIIDDASVLETDFPLISISPNPTAGDFTIAGLELYNNISSMRVSDVNGKLVKELDPTASKFTLGTMKPGVYFLTITAGNNQEVIKIIKE